MTIYFTYFDIIFKCFFSLAQSLDFIFILVCGIQDISILFAYFIIIFD